MIRHCIFPAALILVAISALALRAPSLDNRLMHGDEAINAVKFKDLWEKGVYEYDRVEYHGPTLPYFTLPAFWLSGGDYLRAAEPTYRSVSVAFGIALILLLWLVRDGLGRAPALVAALLTAISPAMVFYSRYHIHEILLVFFTFAAIATGWRYARSANPLWAIACGASLGLMHATKETWIIAAAAMFGALLLTLLWSRLIDRRSLPLKPLLRPKPLLLAAAAAILIASLFFSAFFTNLRGPLDSILAYKVYLDRGTGSTDHNQPWHYYLHLLSYFKYGRGPLSTEALILALALLGFARALIQRSPHASPSPNPELPTTPSLPTPPAHGSIPLLRFLAFYTLLLTAAYSIIPYKTPWCMLSFLHGMILLAAVGAVAIVRWMPHWSLKTAAILLLAAGASHLAWQAYRTNLYQDPRTQRYYAADPRMNPYLYSQPRPDVLKLIERIDDLSRLHPRGREIVITFTTSDVWPIPWYLRAYPNLGGWPRADDFITEFLQPGGRPDIIIAPPTSSTCSPTTSAMPTSSNTTASAPPSSSRSTSAPSSGTSSSNPAPPTLPSNPFPPALGICLQAAAATPPPALPPPPPPSPQAPGCSSASP